jgi:hypothetical protein
MRLSPFRSGRGGAATPAALPEVDELTAANRRERSAEAEERLVDLRHRAFGELGGAAAPQPDPEPVPARPAPEDGGLPAIAASELTPERLAGAISSHGAVIVRGLVGTAEAAELVAGIDRAFDAQAAALSGAPESETTPWYREFVPTEEAAPAVSIGRGFLKSGSGVMTSDSPRMLFDLLETFERAGLRDVISGYLGERPALSVNKGTLRRAKPDVGTAWWHQDGAFLGSDIRAINVWLSLTPSGVDAPGMELVPKRLDGIVETGTKGADFDWSVGDEVVAEACGGPFAWPTFEAGDALLFDHLCLHRTGVNAEMTATRYATETWFFAPSAYPNPLEQVPLAF